MDRILVAIVAGLSPRMVRDSARCPNISSMAESGTFVPLKPVLPALTCTMQATLTTGLDPSGHGVVSNGYYFRDTAKAELWQHSARLINRPRIWDMLREKNDKLTTAALFWWNTLYSTADIYMNVAPVHTAKGETISSCYSKPRGLYDECESALGPFPLHNFWGPMSAIESSRWIAAATMRVLEKYSPALTLTYLPQLDYSSQKYGPDADLTLKDVAAIDEVIGDLRKRANANGAKLIVISEYSLMPVRGDVPLNRVLRKNGFIDVRTVADREYLDTGNSAAFAMVDHQVAHVYVNDKTRLEEVASVLRATDGVDEVLIGVEKEQRGLDHANSGELVALAAKDRWFSYYWWLEEDRAPDFAHTVDIHRKPGYDPVELFLDRERRCIPTDASLVKGSHGLVSDNIDEMAVLVSEVPLPVPAGQPLAATDFAEMILELCR